MTTMHFVRRGAGQPLLLLHGLGGTWRSWGPIMSALAETREVIAVDLPGFGETPPLAGEVSIATLADAVTAFCVAQGLTAVDMVGSSMGARLALELARRGAAGAVVSLDPGGFWNERERAFFGTSIGLSIRLVRLLQPVMPAIAASRIARTLLLLQLSAKPWALSPDLVLDEMRSYARSPSFDQLLDALARGPAQGGMTRGRARQPITIVWGRQDRVCLPRQAEDAMARFPDATLYWVEDCGHFPMWDQPAETVRIILKTVGH